MRRAAAASLPSDTPLLSFAQRAGDSASIEVLGVAPDAPPVSPLLAGKFTEHLGSNVYGGAWAQLLFNPVFAPQELFGEPQNPRDEIRLREEIPATFGFKSGERPFVFDNIAYGWLPFGDGAGCRLARGRKAETRSAQTLIGGVTGAAAGLLTPFYVPKRPVADFTLRLRAAAVGGRPTLKIGVFRAGGDDGLTLGDAVSNVVSLRPASASSSRRLRLQIDRRRLPRDRRVFLVIEIVGTGKVVLERAELFPDDAMDGWDPEVVALWRKAGVRLLRFPGGNFVSGYDWRDGIGPRDMRPVRKNPAWFGCEFNHVGTDEWLRFCELIGAEPLICVNAGDGKPKEAADWIEYCNGEPQSRMGRIRARNGRKQPYGVRLWEVGNELYGGWQIGHASAEEYGKRYDVFSRAMRKADGSIRLLANGHNVEWDRGVVGASRAPLQTLTIHPLIGNTGQQPVTPEQAYRAITAYPVWFERTETPEIRALLAGRDAEPHLAITELQIMGARPGYPRNRSLAEAVYYAGMMNASIRSRGFVDIVTHSALINHGGGMGKERGVVYTDPVYDAHCFYSALVGGAPVALRIASAADSVQGVVGLPSIDSAPAIDAVAVAVSGGKRLRLIVLNRSLERDVRVRIALGPWAAGAKRAAVAVLASERFTDRNTADAPRRVKPRQSKASVVGGAIEFALPRHAIAAIIV